MFVKMVYYNDAGEYSTTIYDCDRVSFSKSLERGSERYLKVEMENNDNSSVGITLNDAMRCDIYVMNGFGRTIDTVSWYPTVFVQPPKDEPKVDMVIDKVAFLKP